MRFQLSSRLLPLVPFPQVIQHQADSDAMDVVGKDGVITAEEFQTSASTSTPLRVCSLTRATTATNNETLTAELTILTSS